MSHLRPSLEVHERRGGEKCLLMHHHLGAVSIIKVR